MKKVLIATNLDLFCYKFLIPYFKYFKENGYIVEVASQGDGSTLTDYDKKYNVDFPRRINIREFKQAYKQIKKILDENTYDIIFCHSPFGAAITRLAVKNCKLKNTRVIYMAHGFHFFKGAPLKNWLLFYPVEKYLSKYTNDIITINQEDYINAQKKFKSNIHYLNGAGFNFEKNKLTLTKKEKNELRKKYNIKPNDFVMIFPGELNNNKNQIMLINIMQNLNEKNKDIHLLLPGNDCLNGQLQEYVKNNKIKNVHFLGFCKNIPELLEISNLAVSSSYREGLPINIMEAMNAGLPIVATNCRGNRDLVNDNNGYLIEPNNIDEFENKILCIYNKEKSLEKIKKYNQNEIKKYALDDVLNKFDRIIKNEKKNRIAYLRSTSIVNDSRATKEIESYKKYNNDVIVFGWNRQNINIPKLDGKYKFYNKQSKYGSGMKNIFKLLGFEIWLYNNLKKERNNYDIIHACDFDTAYIGYKIAKKYNKKLVYDVYDYYVDCHNLSFLKDFIEKKDIKILNNADAVIICTEQRKKQIEKANPKKIYVIHNTPEIKKIKCQNSYNPNKIKVCYVGILQDDRLLKEVCEEISKNSNIELHIGGFGKYEEYIKELSNQYSNIFFYGQMKYDNVLDLENKCDILFATYNPEVPNHKYSAPNKVYEAMALGKPIIVCENTGVDELVKKEKIGFAIKYDAKEFIKKIKEITDNDYKKISDRCYKLYEDKYNWNKMFDNYMKNM